MKLKVKLPVYPSNLLVDWEENIEWHGNLIPTLVSHNPISGYVGLFHPASTDFPDRLIVYKYEMEGSDWVLLEQVLSFSYQSLRDYLEESFEAGL